jgi:2-amino-4-hydroxy-6-hydroxymethyldihydropteridine diphosphokinase
MATTWCLIALGSNVPPCLERIRAAAREASRLLTDARGSKIHRTAPMDFADQDDFLNACLAGRTALSPLALLDRLKSLETKLGRVQRERNGPREIDLDLIAYGRLTLESPRLHLPHPRLAERRFVLEPALEAAPDAWIAGQGPLVSIHAQADVEWQKVESIGEDLLL